MIGWGHLWGQSCTCCVLWIHNTATRASKLIGKKWNGFGWQWVIGVMRLVQIVGTEGVAWLAIEAIEGV